jgi:hypothetical protein
MRFFLSSLLASLAISLLVMVLLVGLGATVYHYYFRQTGDQQPAAVWGEAVLAALGDVWFIALALFGVLMVVVAPLWAAFRAIVVKLQADLLVSNTIFWAACFGILLGICGLVIRSLFWGHDLLQGLPENTAFFLISGLLAGMVWGTVFWIRTPKSVRTELPT